MRAALLLALACRGPSDAERYAEVSQMQPMQTERALAICARIQDPASAADCAMVAATRGARDEGLDPEAWCERVPDGRWRSECWFQASEVRRERGELPAAAALCLKTGPFADDCAQHLWQDELRGLIFARGPEGFVEQLPRAETLWRRWKATLRGHTDLDDRLWRRYYENGFEARRRLDLSACQALEGQGGAGFDHVDRCRHAGANLLLRRLRQVVVVDEPRARLCAATAPRCAEIAVIPQLDCVDDPLLTQVIAEQLDWVCAQGRLDPAPDRGTIRYLKRQAGLIEGADPASPSPGP